MQNYYFEHVFEQVDSEFDTTRIYNFSFGLAKLNVALDK